MQLKAFPFFSGALYSRKIANVLLPPSYAASENQRYPVVYLLHGLYGHEASWLLKGKAEETISGMMKDGSLRECIVVMPSDGGYGHGTFYINWYDGTGRFEDYFLYDLIPAIDREYRTIPSPSRRAVCGLSMGGYGAFVLTLRNPDVFGAAASISGALASVHLMTEPLLRTEICRIIGPVHGPYAREHDVHVLANRCMGQAERPALHFNCGTSDDLFPLNQVFGTLLNHLGYPHEYLEYEGEHNWDYFSSHLPDALRFVERFFAASDEN